MDQSTSAETVERFWEKKVRVHLVTLVHTALPVTWD